METKLSISLAELKLWLEAGRPLRIVDVRSRSEFEDGHVLDAVHFPIEEIENGKSPISTEQIVVTVCTKGGGRSERAARLLRNQSGIEAYFLEGGTNGWMAAQDNLKQ